MQTLKTRWMRWRGSLHIRGYAATYRTPKWCTFTLVLTLTVGVIRTENANYFFYLGSIIPTNGTSFGMLGKVWGSTHISGTRKLKIFNVSAKAVILYGCETWNAATIEIQSLQVFVNRCLRKILRLFSPKTISNNLLEYKTIILSLIQLFCV